MREAERPGEPNIGRWLDHHAFFRPRAPAIVLEDGREITYGELDRQAGALAGHLAGALGIGHGDRVAYLGFNRPEMVALLFACARLGAILAPLNRRLAQAELAFIAGDCTPKALFHDGAHAEAAGAVCGARADCRACAVESLGELAPSQTPDVGRLGDPVLIVYTSGTTGRPKGAVLDQRALLVNALNSIDMHALTQADRVLVALPLFHVGGLNIQLTPALYAGAQVHLHARFDPGAVLDAIETVRPQLLVLVPATMQALMAQARWADADLTSLRMLTTGSTIVPVELIGAFEARGVSVIQVYGSTETCPIATYQRPGDGRTSPRSCGRAALLSEIRIVDDQGLPVAAPGMQGEIEVRGAHVMRGYWNDAAATAAALRDGWFATGDLGALGTDGVLTFRDRKSNVVITGSENVYPAEIERVLRDLEGVADAAVVGLEDETWGEVPAAALVCPGAPPAPAAIRERLDAELARFKHPRHVVVLDALPRNAMGKAVAADVRAAIIAALGEGSGDATD